MRALRDYLAAELGLDGRSAERVELEPCGLVDATPVYRFRHEGEAFFAFGGQVLDFMPVAGMSFEDVARQTRGSAAIVARDPVDLSQSLPGVDDVPSSLERRRHLDEMCEAAGLDPTKLRVGLFLRASGEWLALVGGAEAIALSSMGGSVRVGFPEASDWRRLSWAAAAFLR